MSEFEDARKNVQESLRSRLADALIEKKRDPDRAAEAIVSFVFRREELPGEEQRYEWYYARRNLALNIADGWLSNYLADLSPADAMEESIQTYIRKTYGSNFDKIG